MSSFGKTILSAFLLAALALAPAFCRAEAKCPWLNAATAAGVLGGAVQMTVTEPVEPVGPLKGKGAGQTMYPDQLRLDRFDVSCVFSRKTNSGVSLLRIEVRTMSDRAAEFPSVLANCAGVKVPLRAVGNEAYQCRVDSSGHSSVLGEEIVIGRIRDRFFVLTIRRDEAGSAAASTGAGGGLRDDTRNIAEQVAGSLF